jgi:pSer/pThr/pTyr-binding forkhead associated (FHA) protein
MAGDDIETEFKARRPKASRDPAARPCLQILGGAEVGKLIVLEVGTAVIGRGASAKIRLDDNGVSREHAKVIVSEDVVNLVDNRSTNGTYLNGAPVDAGILRDGDRIHIGPDVTLLFVYVDPNAEPKSRMPPAPVVKPEEPVPLSPRELEVAQLVADGLTNPEIGKRLFISPRTVTTHLVKIYDRLGVHSRAALTRYILERGLLKQD